MPFYHEPRTFVPLPFLAERKAIKNGVHHSIFTPAGSKYVGDWSNDKRSGKGFFVSVSGHMYEGDWQDGFRHGFGILSRRLPNGTFTLQYRGDWHRGKPHGIGWMYYDNGDVFVGFWRHGARSGYGKLWRADGTYYVGYWRDDQRDGLGMFVQENGNRYEGHWQAGARHGRGRFYHMRTGQLQDGVWADDVCVMSRMQDILIRQFVVEPTPYPIPEVKVRNPQALLEESELWFKQKIGKFDKDLQLCVDAMVELEASESCHCFDKS